MLFRKDENQIMLKSEVKQLRGDYKKTYHNMTIYLASFSLNYYAQQDVLLELAGICLENQKRGITMEEVFNHDYKAFCDSLIENCKRKTLKEKLLEYVLMFAVICLIEFVLICISKATIDFYPNYSMTSPLYIKQGALYFSANNLLLILGLPLLFTFAYQIQFRFVYASKAPLIILIFIGYFIGNYTLNYLFKHIWEKTMLVLPIYLTVILLALGTLVLYVIYYSLQQKSYRHAE